MILKFTRGFDYNDMPYGWLRKVLYRLPITLKGEKDGRKINYPLKRLKEITIGNKVGYRIGRDKKTIDQLEYLTNSINVEYNKIVDDNCPFN